MVLKNNPGCQCCREYFFREGVPTGGYLTILHPSSGFTWVTDIPTSDTMLLVDFVVSVPGLPSVKDGYYMLYRLSTREMHYYPRKTRSPFVPSPHETISFASSFDEHPAVGDSPTPIGAGPIKPVNFNGRLFASAEHNKILGVALLNTATAENFAPTHPYKVRVISCDLTGGGLSIPDEEKYIVDIKALWRPTINTVGPLTHILPTRLFGGWNGHATLSHFDGGIYFANFYSDDGANTLSRIRRVGGDLGDGDALTHEDLMGAGDPPTDYTAASSGNTVCIARNSLSDIQLWYGGGGAGRPIHSSHWSLTDRRWISGTSVENTQKSNWEIRQSSPITFYNEAPGRMTRRFDFPSQLP
jgi:hypothetical protein